MLELVLATRNKHKVTELRALLHQVVALSDLSDYPMMPEVEETGATFLANAILKAEAVAAYTGKTALADDSGLEVDALGGAPGVFSARYSGPDATDARNRAKLLAALADIPQDKRTARFVCAIAIATPGEPTWTTIGTHSGLITFAEMGENGFGYDALFYSPEFGATFAQVDMARKNEDSHRGRALAQVVAYFQKQLGAEQK
jgi:XTP/dITP diphosphohydrolase